MERSIHWTLEPVSLGVHSTSVWSPLRTNHCKYLVKLWQMRSSAYWQLHEQPCVEFYTSDGSSLVFGCLLRELSWDVCEHLLTWMMWNGPHALIEIYVLPAMWLSVISIVSFMKYLEEDNCQSSQGGFSSGDSTEFGEEFQWQAKTASVETPWKSVKK